VCKSNQISSKHTLNRGSAQPVWLLNLGNFFPYCKHCTVTAPRQKCCQLRYLTENTDGSVRRAAIGPIFATSDTSGLWGPRRAIKFARGNKMLLGALGKS
jgi:hypothetical protein